MDHRLGGRLCRHKLRIHGDGTRRESKRRFSKKFRAMGKRDPADAPRKYRYFGCDCWGW